ncbi:MAG: hypothetical protein ACLQDY_11100 [Streptosporangiaceae bacterium]
MAGSRQNPSVPLPPAGRLASGLAGADHAPPAAAAHRDPGGEAGPAASAVSAPAVPGTAAPAPAVPGTAAPGTGGAGTGGAGTGAAGTAPGAGRSAAGGRTRMPPVRLAPRDELAAAARVAPLLRAARDLARWAAGQAPAEDAGGQDRPSAARPSGEASVVGACVGQVPPPGRPLAGPRPASTEAGGLDPAAAAAAAEALEITPHEVEAAWRVALATGMAGDPAAGQAGPEDHAGLLAASSETVLAAWGQALAAVLAAEELDGLATALYTVGGPVRMDSLFEAYASAAAGQPQRAGQPPGREPGAGQPDETAALSAELETLADLGVVELGTDDSAGGLTVALSPLGVWGVHRRLRAQGWHVPVLGSEQPGAAGLLVLLASCDAEDGETEITGWLEQRAPARAAAELIEAAAGGSPGLRGAAFAVLDRIGEVAVPAVRAALANPVLRAHAAVWLHEHGEEAELSPDDRTWLLVDLGAGLLEEADPRDVVAELLPEVSPDAQAEIVAGLWQVRHPAVTELLTALSEHHPDPAVARAARKAAFKARSPAAGAGAG